MQAEPQVHTRAGIYFRGIEGQKIKPYPIWRYHKFLPPIVVCNTEEDMEKRKEGYEPLHIPITANKQLINWIWDLEDFSPRQLVVYAEEEFGVKLPVEAGQEKLLKAVLELAKFAPQNRNRLVLMAHTIKMNYDETLTEIRKMAENGWGETETEVFEV